MINTSHRITWGIGAVALVLAPIAGCSRKAEGPSAPTASSQTVTVKSLAISGDTALSAPGQTSQFRAVATLSDGSTKDVTSSSSWFTSNASVVTIAPGGLATARALGKANVFADAFGTDAPALTIEVLPIGTVIVSGIVAEAGKYPIAGATVQILDGPWAGVTTVTDPAGAFAFNGVSGVTQVRATREGYADATTSVGRDTEHANIVMTPAVANASLAGVYRLTFTASPSCHLPADAMTRTYTAKIDQDGPLLKVTLSDAQFGLYFNAFWNTFSGRVLGHTVTFTLNAGYDALYLGGVADKLADGQYLMISGTAATQISDPPLSMALAGVAQVITSPQNIWGPTATCSAADHQLVFSAR